MFKKFPEFSKLNLEDKAEHESLIKDFPPVGDISFNMLLLWWGSLGEVAVSKLGNNLVISYWLPGDDAQSGLSLVGVDNVDESICVVFDYLRERGEKPRLVNVPEFVVNSLRYPELFSFRPGSGRDEYIVTISKFADLDQTPQYMRIRLRKFVREHDEANLIVRDIDLRSIVNRQLLLEASERWPQKGVNSMTKFGRQFLPVVVSNGSTLGLRCVGLYVGKVLQAYCLYSPTNDSRYITLVSARINYDIPRIFDYTIHAFARHLSKQGLVYANLYSDSDSPTMRIVKIAFKPDSFFRKYTIEPA